MENKDKINPYDNLCSYDPRSTDYDPQNDRMYSESQCFCDNCFYGRHVLADEIIRLRSIIDKNTIKQDDQTK